MPIRSYKKSKSFFCFYTINPRKTRSSLPTFRFFYASEGKATYEQTGKISGIFLVLIKQVSSTPFIDFLVSGNQLQFYWLQREHSLLLLQLIEGTSYLRRAEKGSLHWIYITIHSHQQLSWTVLYCNDPLRRNRLLFAPSCSKNLKFDWMWRTFGDTIDPENTEYRRSFDETQSLHLSNLKQHPSRWKIRGGYLKTLILDDVQVEIIWNILETTL